MTDKSQQADKRHSSAPCVGLEVEVEGPGSLGNYRRLGEGRLEDTRHEGGSHVEMTSEDRRASESLGFQTAERKPDGRSFQEQMHEGYEVKNDQATPVLMHRRKSAEGVSFRDSAHQTSRIDRPVVPEDILTPDKAERILNETKYETAPDIAKFEQKKKTQTKEAVPPSPSQRKANKERRQLNFEEISGTSSSEDDKRNPRSSSTKKKTPNKTAKKQN